MQKKKKEYKTAVINCKPKKREKLHVFVIIIKKKKKEIKKNVNA